MTVGERIGLLRKINKMSQQEFADSIEISRTHISKIENNKDQASSKLLQVIAEQFNVNYEWLKSGNGEMCLSEKDILLKSPEYLKHKMKETSKNMDTLLHDSNNTELQLHLYSIDLLLNSFLTIKNKFKKEDYINYATALENLLEELWLLSISSSNSRLLANKENFIKAFDKVIAVLEEWLNT
ncbi:MAG: helix-turn-helix domain-containing protein [Ruminococcus sp.]